MSEIENQSEEELIHLLAQNLAAIKIETLEDPANGEFLSTEDLSLQDEQVLNAMIDLGIAPSRFDREVNKKVLQDTYEKELLEVIAEVQKGTYIQGYSHGYKEAEEVIDMIADLPHGKIQQMVFDMFSAMKENGEYTYQIYAMGYTKGFIDRRDDWQHEG